MTRSNVSRAAAWVRAGTWAMRETELELILDIAEREITGGLEAARARREAQPERVGTALTVRNGVAVIPVIGPIFRYANLFAEISGATSIELLARDLEAALGNEAVRAIVLQVDSPGGEVTGVSAFAEQVLNADKLIVAHVDGLAASAAYWIASAAEEIIIAPTASLGSVGVVASVLTDERDNVVEIVSSQSPRKRPDVRTESGRQQIQAHVDALAGVFIAAVAENRATTRDHVLESYGRGGMLVGADAVAVGMADRIGTLESVIRGLAARPVRVA